ncbi:MAG: CotH kinase family protein [Bacteroidota bacterium]
MLRSLVLTVIVFLFGSHWLHAQLYINEFMASNTNTIADPQGDYEDWIEIYNAGPHPIDLAGYAFSDDSSQLSLSEIPSGFPAQTTVPAGGFLLFWADDDAADGPLHLEMKLSAGGESLFLVDPDGQTILDSISFGPQISNLSYGRSNDGGVAWQVFTAPTPEASNQTSGIPTYLARSVRRIEAGADDGTEVISSQNLALNEQSIEMGENQSAESLISAFRFSSLPFPSAAFIQRAYVRFDVAFPDSQATSLTIDFENTGHANPIAADVPSNRSTIGGGVNWTLPPWTDEGDNESSPDLTNQVKQIVDRGDWQAGNAMLLLVEGNGRRQATAFEADSFQSARLIVDYLMPLSLSPVSQLYINELSPANDTIHDDFGQKDDWIELYNGGTTAVQLGGLFLSDDPDDLTKWQISAAVDIQPGAFTLVYADEDVAQGGLHAGFKLDNDGEWLGLVQLQNGLPTIIDSVRFDATEGLLSRGRKTDGGNDWVLFEGISPGNSNNGQAERVEPPVFSLTGGLYTQAMTLQLSCPTVGTTIYYTTDGSQPGTSSQAYVGPISLDSTMSVRAMAWLNSSSRSSISSQNYIINHQSDLPAIYISMDPAHLWSDTAGMYVVGTNGTNGNCMSTPVNWNQDWEYPAHVSFHEADGSFGFAVDAGVSIAGGCSRKRPQKSLNIATKNIFSENRIDYSVFDSEDQEQFRRLRLRNSGNEWQKTMMRDALVQSLVTNEVDIDVNAYRPSVLYLNGEYWGIHNVREVYSRHYIGYHFPEVDKDSLDLFFLTGGNVRDVYEGDPQSYNDLHAYATANDLSDPVHFAYMQNNIDINEYINYHILQIYISNTDWPGNNVRIWREKGGKFRWMLFDTDFGFGHANSSSATHNTLEFATTDGGSGWPNQPKATLLLRKLLENQTFADEFIQRFATQLNTLYTPERISHFVDSLSAGIANEIPSHINRWGSEGGINSTNAWGNHLDKLYDFGNERTPNMISHIISYFNLDSTYQLHIPLAETGGGHVLLNQNQYPAPFDYEGVYFDDVAFPLTAVAKDGFYFSHWLETGDTNATIILNTNEDTTLTPIFLQEPVINEIHYHPIGGSDYEFIELHNPNAISWDMDGYYFSKGISDSLIGISLQPGEYVLFVKDSSKYTHLPVRVFQWESGNLANNGETIRLRKANGDIADEVKYNDNLPWPIEPDGTGGSLMLRHPGYDNEQADFWKSCCNDSTPGYTNERVYAPAGVTEGLNLWLEADTSYLITGAGTGIRTWMDRSQAEHPASQSTDTDQPVFTENVINGHGVVSFDGADDWMKINGVVESLNDSCTIFSVFLPEADTKDGYYLSTHLGGGNRLKFGHRKNNGELIYDDDSPSLSADTYLNQSVMTTLVVEPNVQVDGYIDGALASPWTGFSSSGADRASLGQEFDGSGTDNQTSNHWTGKLAEMLIYDRWLDDSTRQAVETYLSVKYGLTIPVASHQFYDHDSHPDGLVGIGVDLHNQCFVQDNSRSESPGSILRIQSPSSLHDGEYLVIGHDGGSADASAASNQVPAYFLDRLSRNWRVNKTGDPGKVDLIFDLTDLNWSLTDPLQWQILLDDDGDFSNAKSPGQIPELIDNHLIFSQIYLEDDQYVALGRRKYVRLDVQVYLSAAYDASASLMRDDLRQKRLIPYENPYQTQSVWAHDGTESVSQEVLNVSGSTAMVDWVLVQLRDPDNNNLMVSSRAALLLANGKVVATDGESELDLTTSPGSYLVSIRHRNHLDILTEEPIDLDTEALTIDFTIGEFGTESQMKSIGVNLFGLWSGDVNADQKIVYQGSNADPSSIYLSILLDPANTTFARNFIITDRYDAADANLDGDVIFQGLGSDQIQVFLEILTHPGNSSFSRNFVIQGLLP